MIYDFEKKEGWCEEETFYSVRCSGGSNYRGPDSTGVSCQELSFKRETEVPYNPQGRRGYGS